MIHIKELALTIIIGLIVMTILPMFLDFNNLTSLVIYAMLALSLGFIWGYGGILCFGQAAFFGLGAYAFAISAINFDSAWAAFFVAMAVPAIIAFAFGGMLFYGRLSDVYLAVVTLVFTLILYKFTSASAGEAYKIGNARLGGFNGIPGFETLTLPWDASEYLYDDKLYYLCFALLLVCYAFLRFLLKTHFGRILVGLADNELRAQLMGYDVRWIKTLAFSLGAGIAGLAGCLYANWAEIVTPKLFSLGQSGEIIIWVIVGGAGTLVGPMVGAGLLGFLKYMLGQQSLVDNVFIMGVILIIAVLLLPRGIFPLFQDGFKRLFSSKNSRGDRAQRKSRMRKSSNGGDNNA